MNLIKLKKRSDFIYPYIKNKIVLDIGFIGDKKINGKYSWLFSWLLKNCKEVIGVDINKEVIDQLKKEGYKVIYDDANFLVNTLKLNKKFDVIIVGDILMYLENIGTFFSNMNKLLNPGGHLIITINNIMGLWQLFEFFIKNNDQMKGTFVSFTKTNLKNFATKYGFNIVEEKYFINDECICEVSFLSKIIWSCYPKLYPNLGIIFKKGKNVKLER